MIRISKKLMNATNVILFLLGIIVIIISFVPEFLPAKEILISIGASFLSTSIITWITRHYVFELDRKKELIEEWGLKNIYKSKAVMNTDSNKLLDHCKKNLDVIAVGMSGFLSVKGDVLEKLVNNGVQIRLLICNPDSPAIAIRANDEPSMLPEKLKADVLNLQKWITDMKDKYPTNSLEVKMHNTYPAFAYLRIDKIVFWGPNLYLMPSQLSMAYSFDSSGNGFDYFSDYFDKLWNTTEFCS